MTDKNQNPTPQGSPNQQVYVLADNNLINELKKLVDNTQRVTISQTDIDKVKSKIDVSLDGIKRVSVAFPHCTDVLLAHIKTTNVNYDNKDDITKQFDGYFQFGKEQNISINKGDLDDNLLTCLTTTTNNITQWPPDSCVPVPCVKLSGNRNIKTTPAQPFYIKRLFVADVVWLFYFERMGIFKILGEILDAYAYSGKYPISNSSLNSGLNDDISAIILESMVRQMRTGAASITKDREVLYKRALGWTLNRQLKTEPVVNTSFNNLFHKFIQIALEYYKDKRLATAIQAATSSSKTSTATIVSIRDTLSILKKTFDAFNYGRCYYNTLSGIVWVIAGMALIREMKTTFGIPEGYKEPNDYIPAAYDILVEKRPITQSDINRYTVHRDCAINARDMLLDIQVLDLKDTKELDIWLDIVEDKIEGYRTAYRNLTGVDLGMPPSPGTPKIEQQA